MDTNVFVGLLDGIPKNDLLYINKNDISVYTSEGYEVRKRKPDGFVLDGYCINFDVFSNALKCFESGAEIVTSPSKIIFKKGRRRINIGVVEYSKPVRLKQKNVLDVPVGFEKACDLCGHATLYKASVTSSNLYVHIKDNILYFSDNIMCVRYRLSGCMPDIVVPFLFIRLIGGRDVTHVNYGTTCTLFKNKDFQYMCPVYDCEPTSFDFIFENEGENISLPNEIKGRLESIKSFFKTGKDNTVTIDIKNKTCTVAFVSDDVIFNDTFDVTSTLNASLNDYRFCIKVNGAYLYNTIKIMGDDCTLWFNKHIYVSNRDADIAVSTLD